jgi:4-hydroxybutyrate CoA-transferase
LGWQEEYKRKSISLEDAARVVKSGDTVIVAWGGGMPVKLCQSLAKRKDELENVTIFNTVNFKGHISWYEPEYSKAFRVKSQHLRRFDRPPNEAKRLEYGPMSIGMNFNATAGFIRESYQPPDVYLVLVSPPDKHGFCSLGSSIWITNFYTKVFRAKTVVAQVDKEIFRTYGDSYLHVSQIDWFTETEGEPHELEPLYRATEEERMTIETIGSLASSLINDRDCIFIGGGGISQRVIAFLEDKKDLGIHTEIFLSGIVDLVEGGVFTGKYKGVHQGKAVASEFLATPAEREIIAENPRYEFYGVEYLDYPKRLAMNDNLVAVNTALGVDLTGQICSEAIGSHQYSGSGGQLDSVIGAMMSRGGRSITCLPSTYNRGQQVLSRIVPLLQPGTPVTVPRTLADYIITEFGIANLQGKTLKERAEALIDISHPDFRGYLRKEFAKLAYY